MFLLTLSFLAGILTILTPCVLPVIPVIVGGSIEDKDRWKPVRIVSALAITVFIFTLLLKVSTLFIGVNNTVWEIASGFLIMLVGLAMLFNKQWQYIAVELGLSNRSHEALHDNTQKNSALSDIFVGIVLGPVFTSCSPTYFFIVGTVIPQDLATGIINLIVYILGLTISLLLVSFAGQKLLSKLQVYSRPDSKVRQVVAILFIVTGFLIASGLIKDLEAYLIQSSGVDFLYLESKLQEMIPSNSNF